MPLWSLKRKIQIIFQTLKSINTTANINKKTNGRICHIPFSWEARWIFWLFNLSPPPRLIWFLIAFVCISNKGASPLYLLTSDDAHMGSFFCFKYLQLFILANSCRQLLTGQHSENYHVWNKITWPLTLRSCQQLCSGDRKEYTAFNSGSTTWGRAFFKYDFIFQMYG